MFLQRPYDTSRCEYLSIHETMHTWLTIVFFPLLVNNKDIVPQSKEDTFKIVCYRRMVPWLSPCLLLLTIWCSFLFFWHNIVICSFIAHSLTFGLITLVSCSLPHNNFPLKQYQQRQQWPFSYCSYQSLSTYGHRNRDLETAELINFLRPLNLS